MQRSTFYLANEEGAVVQYQEQKLAIYKNSQGAVSVVSSTCTHAGCIVQWNAEEKSWDCPCHGARYRPDGSVLNGPAVTSLRKIELD